MKTMLKKLGSMMLVAVLVASPLLIVSCSGDSNPTGSSSQPSMSPALSGTYDTNYRWGGASGLWRGSEKLVVANDGSVTYGSTLIKNPDVTDSTIAWLMADGNPQSAAITFRGSDNNAYYWSDKGSVSKRSFTGWKQNPGEGKLDFRGLIE